MLGVRDRSLYILKVIVIDIILLVSYSELSSTEGDALHRLQKLIAKVIRFWRLINLT